MAESTDKVSFPFEEDHYFSTRATSPRSHHGEEDETYVKIIQEAVGVEPSGEYDEATREAVMEYQKKHKQDVTGVVDAKLWKKMAG